MQLLKSFFNCFFLDSKSDYKQQFNVLQMSQNKSESWGIICRFSWLGKNKNATIYPINKNNCKCFQYAATFALNLEEIGKKLRKNNNN